jgi:4-aminobutyrate aminotransferase
MQALEFVRHDKAPAPDLARAFLSGTKDRGLLVGLGGLWNNTVRIAPPLTVTEDEVRVALETMGDVLAAMYQAEPELQSVPSTRIPTAGF